MSDIGCGSAPAPSKPGSVGLDPVFSALALGLNFMRIIRVCLAAAALVPCAAGADTTPAEVLARPAVSFLNAADGLPSEAVEAIVQDRLGYLWIGTRGGLVRTIKSPVFVYIIARATDFADRKLTDKDSGNADHVLRRMLTTSPKMKASERNKPAK